MGRPQFLHACVRVSACAFMHVCVATHKRPFAGAYSNPKSYDSQSSHQHANFSLIQFV